MTLSYLLNLYNTNCAVKITKLKTCPVKSFASFIFGYPASPCHTILKSCHLKQPQNPQCPGCKNYSSPLLVRWPWAYRSWFESDRRLSSCCEPESMTEHVGIKFKLNGKWPKGAETIIKWQPNLWQPIIASMFHPVQPWMASLKFFHSWLYANQRAKSQNMLDCWRKVKLKLVLTYPGLTFAFPLGAARFNKNNLPHNPPNPRKNKLKKKTKKNKSQKTNQNWRIRDSKNNWKQVKAKIKKKKNEIIYKSWWETMIKCV